MTAADANAAPPATLSDDELAELDRLMEQYWPSAIPGLGFYLRGLREGYRAQAARLADAEGRGAVWRKSRDMLNEEAALWSKDNDNLRAEVERLQAVLAAAECHTNRSCCCCYRDHHHQHQELTLQAERRERALITLLRTVHAHTPHGENDLWDEVHEVIERKPQPRAGEPEGAGEGE